mmetsp:Transcript_55405/g.98653  ORF Transcript_55405/g.98653 Transcript_55405/m.98653 type:complete len:839 (-) Transcript_55405:981-3497(-)
MKDMSAEAGSEYADRLRGLAQLIGTVRAAEVKPAMLQEWSLTMHAAVDALEEEMDGLRPSTEAVESKLNVPQQRRPLASGQAPSAKDSTAGSMFKWLPATERSATGSGVKHSVAPAQALSIGLHMLVEAITSFFGASGAACYMPDHDDLNAVVRVGHIEGFPGGVALTTGLPFGVFKSGVAVMVEEYMAYEGSTGGASVLCFPIWSAEQRSVLGSIEIHRKHSPFTDADAAALNRFIPLLAYCCGHYPGPMNFFNPQALHALVPFGQTRPSHDPTIPKGLTQDRNQYIYRSHSSGQHMRRKQMMAGATPVITLDTAGLQEVNTYIAQLETTWKAGAAELAVLQIKSEKTSEQLRKTARELHQRTQALTALRQSMASHARTCESFSVQIKKWQASHDHEPEESATENSGDVVETTDTEGRIMDFGRQVIRSLSNCNLLAYLRQLKKRPDVGPGLVAIGRRIKEAMAGVDPLMGVVALAAECFEGVVSWWQPLRNTGLLMRTVLARITYNKLVLAKEALRRDGKLNPGLVVMLNKLEKDKRSKLLSIQLQRRECTERRQQLRLAFNPESKPSAVEKRILEVPLYHAPLLDPAKTHPLNLKQKPLKEASRGLTLGEVLREGKSGQRLIMPALWGSTGPEPVAEDSQNGPLAEMTCADSGPESPISVQPSTGGTSPTQGCSAADSGFAIRDPESTQAEPHPLERMESEYQRSRTWFQGAAADPPTPRTVDQESSACPSPMSLALSQIEVSMSGATSTAGLPSRPVAQLPGLRPKREKLAALATKGGVLQQITAGQKKLRTPKQMDYMYLDVKTGGLKKHESTSKSAKKYLSTTPQLPNIPRR